MSRSDEGEKRPLFSERARAERRARASRLGSPYLFPLVIASLSAVLLWHFRAELASLNLPVAAAGPETQVREALAHQERASLADVYGFHAGGTAELRPVRYGDVTVSVEDGKARVLAMVEARGQVVWRSERADLAYVGREAFGMTRCSIALYCGDGQQFSGLRGVLLPLFRRGDAAAAGDLEALSRLVSPRYAAEGGKEGLLARMRASPPLEPGQAHVRAWQIRVERDLATVGEDYDLASGAGRTEKRRALYVLVREGERWLFQDGL